MTKAREWQGIWRETCKVGLTGKNIVVRYGFSATKVVFWHLFVMLVALILLDFVELVGVWA